MQAILTYFALLLTGMILHSQNTIDLTITGFEVKNGKTFKLATHNPRVLLNKLEWGIGGAKFFGQSTDPFCEEIQQSIDLFPNFKPAGEFYLAFGLERTKNLLEENCK